jgi:FkbM family methyltransferase
MACLKPGLQVVNVTTPLYRFRMALYTERDIVSRQIAKRGYWEISDPSELAMLAGTQSLPVPAAGRTFLDIGANMGFYSFLFAAAGYSVVSLEPLAHNRRAIEGTLCLNPALARRIRLIPVALGTPRSEREVCVIESSTVNNRGNGVMRCGEGIACPRAGRKVCEVVRLRRLDAVLAELQPRSIDVVKMDVEGAECDALEGGQTLLSQYKPALVQIELKMPKVTACALREAAKHNYRFGTKRGHDNNAVMSRHPLDENASPEDAPRRRTVEAVRRRLPQRGRREGWPPGGSPHKL